MSTLSKSLGMIALGLSVSGCAGDITHGSLEASSIGAVLQNPQTGQTVMLPDVPGRNPRPADENTRRIMSGNFAPTDRGDRFTDLWELHREALEKHTANDHSEDKLDPGVEDVPASPEEIEDMQRQLDKMMPSRPDNEESDPT